ncbi:MAG: hypothetical protein KIT60_16400 [Burkholderiaceae bacterium]|nr:hypothetical protein [Burkholderiaceae bacterium]
MLPPCSFTLLDQRAGFHIEGRGRPVVLLHGASDGEGTVRTLLERMGHSHRVIAVDVDPQRGPDSVDSVLRIGLLPGERFHLVGHRQGVAAALRIAQARPRRLYSLTLCQSEPAEFEDLRHIIAPTRWQSGRDGHAPAIDRFIRDVDALDLPTPWRAG